MFLSTRKGVIPSIIIVLISMFSFPLSGVTFKSGKFDVLVMIDEDEAEDQALVTKIENEMIAASNYLWNATGKQHQFGTVTILIPKKWADKPEYKPLDDENPPNADITVGNKFSGAYASGSKIFVNPTEMKENGRVIIHEFGHAVYGLGDEYCDYFFGIRYFWWGGNWLKCTEKVTFKIYPPFDFPIQTREINSNNERASIMWVQWQPTIVDFCDASNHNSKAQTHQQDTHGESCKATMEKTKYNYKQTGGTATDGAAPTIIKKKYKEYWKTALVVDRSGSMAGLPLTLAKIAALIYVQLAETSNYIGVVQFSTGASIVKNLTKLTNTTKPQIQSAISGLSSDGATSIGDGLLKGMTVAESNPELKYKKNIIVFTDGEENTAPYIADVLAGIIAKEITVYGIGLGYLGSSNQSLRSLCDESGGVFQSVNDYDGLPGVFNDIHCRITPEEIVLLNKKENIDPGKTSQFNVYIDSSISHVLKFNITDDDAADIDFYLTNPKGAKYKSNYSGYSSNEGFKFFKIADKEIIGGDWKLNVTNNSTSVVNPTVSAIAKSTIRVDAFVEKKEIDYPEPIHIKGIATKSNVVLRGLTVYARITSPWGNEYTLPLNDNGINGDFMPEDGCYEGLFTQYDEDGNYSITVFFNNITNTAVMGAGFPEFNPDETQQDGFSMAAEKGVPLAENISRQINAPSVTLSGYNPYDPIAPGRIDSLMVDSYNANTISLKWAAPGGSGFIGKADSYEMRYSTVPLTDNNFTSGTLVSGLPTPLDPGTIQGVAVNVPGNNVYYFAIRAENQEGAKSSVSNNAILSTLVTVDSSIEIIRSWLISKKYGKVTIHTGNLSQAGISKLQLFRRSSDETDFTQIKEIPVAEIKNNLYTFYEKNLTGGKTYYYWVKAVDGVNFEIVSSNQCQLTY